MRRYSTALSFFGLILIMTGLVNWGSPTLPLNLFSPPSTPIRQIILPAPQSHPTPTATPDPGQEQYYRGVFEACSYYSARERPSAKKKVKETCKDLIDTAQRRKWYEMPTPGWEWPVKTDKQEG